MVIRTSQIPSPPSVGSNGSGSGSSSGSAPRAGTREVHNKLEKNRRAHLKECFELLKRQLPATSDDKKTSNLSILGSAIRYIQVSLFKCLVQEFIFAMRNKNECKDTQKFKVVPSSPVGFFVLWVARSYIRKICCLK